MLSHTRMGVPYEYTHMGRPIRVWDNIRIWGRTVTCSYKQPNYNICVSSTKLTYSSQDSLFHSESIYIGFKLTTPTVQELHTPQDGLHELEKEKLGQNNI